MAAFAAALTTAIPVIDKIVSTIWPSGDKKDTKKSKTDAASAVSDLKEESGGALKSLSDELLLLATLLESCLPAEDGIVSMRAVLNATRKGALCDDDKLTIQKSWDLVKANIKEIKDKQKTAVSAISDEFTKSTFLEVVNANLNDIDEDLKKWAFDPLRQDVNDLYKSLNKVNKVAPQVIAGISVGLGKLSATQTKPQGGKPGKSE